MDNTTYNALVETIRHCLIDIRCEGCPYENVDGCPITSELAVLAVDAIESLQRGDRNGQNAV